MQRALRLTITAVGEPDSVFLTPCDPITLHESAVEAARTPNLPRYVEFDAPEFDTPDEDEPMDPAAAEALEGLAEENVLVMTEEQDPPRRRRAS